jgi:hypothetical protein
MGKAAIAEGVKFVRGGWEYYIGERCEVETPLHVGAMRLQLNAHLQKYFWSES